MSGKPAARQGDMTRKGLDIVQGSAGVLIGAPTGVACSVCPGGITYANPVNPVLGAKVLPGETDLALPCPLPFILFRAYSSYRTRTPAPVGVFGPGWKAPFDIRLQIRDEGLILNDSGGRSIHFEPLFPGEISYSRSESLWLARGGVAAQHSSQPLSALWQVLPEDVRLSPHVYLATNSLQGPWWILSWPERVPGADEVLPPEPPAYRVLTGVVDGFGRTLAFHRAAEGDVAGAVTGVMDGAGRRFHLVLTTQAQRAEEARKPHTASLSSPDSPCPLSAPSFPDTLPAGTEYGADNGIRLEAVWLTHDPAYPDEQPTAPLARYTYTAGGELRAVYDRSGMQVRGFTYDAEHAGRMVAHHYAGRPESCYRYDDTGRVTEQVNPEGLDYRFEYGESRVIITDSLNRREVLYTEGEGGLKRVVKKEHADGSITRSESLWLARGGVAAQHSSQPLSALWQVLPEDVRLSPHVYLATNSLQGPWWILSWPEPPAYRVLTVVVDGFGRSLTFHRAAEGDVAGAVTGVTDGAGRRFHMALSTQAQRAEASRKQRASSLSSPASPRSVSSSQVFPDTLPAGTEYGADNGIRLEAVWLTHDPAYPDEQPTAPLARYTYTAGGELRAVYDRSGMQVRGFTYDAEHAGRMVAHHYAGRPESCYRYDDTGRVTEQVNPEGLDYRFEYGESRVIITDSLNRREVLYTEGEGGLKRVVKKEHADGSITRSEYDEAGRLKAQTDAAGDGRRGPPFSHGAEHAGAAGGSVP
ncbi:rhs core protein with extension [Shigella sonnei]|nr:rhs core protein with extension [Shigella sonnei]